LVVAVVAVVWFAEVPDMRRVTCGVTKTLFPFTVEEAALEVRPDSRREGFSGAPTPPPQESTLFELLPPQKTFVTRSMTLVFPPPPWPPMSPTLLVAAVEELLR
jgi:hypothetical protein